MFDPEEVLVAALVVIPSLTLHEFAHAAVATALGDDLARQDGRLTLNPLKHLDLVGAICLIVGSFGWAKPVRVNPSALSIGRRRGMALVGSAGPCINLLIGCISAALWAGLRAYGINAADDYVLVYVALINVGLALFNLLPVPPLDGSRLLAGIVPERWAHLLDCIEGRAGALLVFIILVTSQLPNSPISLLLELAEQIVVTVASIVFAFI